MPVRVQKWRGKKKPYVIIEMNMKQTLEQTLHALQKRTHTALVDFITRIYTSWKYMYSFTFIEHYIVFIVLYYYAPNESRISISQHLSQCNFKICFLSNFYVSFYFLKRSIPTKSIHNIYVYYTKTTECDCSL